MNLQHSTCSLVATLAFFMGVNSLAADDGGIRLLRATYKIANEKSTATSLVIATNQADGTARRFLVTARHVMESMAGNRCVIVNRIEQAPGVYARNEISIVIRRDGQPIWKGHPTQDLAVIELPPELDLHSLPYDCIANESKLGEAAAGESVRTAVYPERSEANPPGFAILRGGSIASYPLVPLAANPAFLVDTTTWTGDSGGPVMHAEMRTETGNPIILGFVRGMRNITDTTRESRFIEKRVHYPLGIAEITAASHLLDLIPAPEAAAE